METVDIFETIELYLKGGLRGKALEEFNAKLKSDKEFAEKVENIKAGIMSIELNGRFELKNKLEKIHKEVITNKTSYNFILKIAAIFVGLILLSSPFIYHNFFNKTDNEQLFASYFKTYPDIISQRSSEMPANIMLEEAMSYYKNEEYENAIVLFNELLDYEYKDNIYLRFYCGISYLGIGNIDQAREIFRNLSNDTNSKLYYQVKWYLALSYLKNGNNESAEELLKEVIENKGYNQKNAKKLLKKL